MPLSPRRHPLYKATTPRLGDIADPPNTRNRYRKSAQIGKNTSNKRTGKISRKRTRWNGGRQLTKYGVPNLVVRMFKEVGRRRDEFSDNLKG